MSTATDNNNIKLDTQDNKEFPKLESIDFHSIIQQKIVNLYFHLTRKTEWRAIHELSTEFDGVLDFIFRKLRESIALNALNRENTNNSNNIIADISKLQKYLSILFRLIGQTRDVVHGKGERDLTYMLISVWYNYLPIPAMFALRLITQNMDDSTSCSGLFSSYGSWSDIKHFCNYIHMRERDEKKKSVLIDTALGLLNHQLAVDKRNWEKVMDEYINDNSVNIMSLKTRPCGRDEMSLAAKWVPREKSKFGWLFDILAEKYCAGYLRDDELLSKNDNINKKKCYYRKLISRLNRELDTVQIKQCSNQWADIDPQNVSITTMMKQNKAFMNMNGSPKKSDSKIDDRDICATNFREFHENSMGSMGVSNHMHKKTVISVCDYVKKAFELIESKSSYKPTKDNDAIDLQIKWLNQCWKKMDHSQQRVTYIPILDISYDLSSIELNTAIGIAIIVAQSSTFSRIMISEHNPEWIIIPDNAEFVDIVESMYKYIKHATAFNITKTFDLISQSIQSTNMSMNDIENINFVVITRFQDANISWKQLSEDFYIKHHVVPYMIYWNINVNGNECDNISKELIEMNERTLLISGRSSTVLEYFNKFGMEGIRNMKPYEYILEILDAPRYKPMGEYFDHYLAPMIHKQIQLL